MSNSAPKEPLKITKIIPKKPLIVTNMLNDNTKVIALSNEINKVEDKNGKLQNLLEKKDKKLLAVSEELKKCSQMKDSLKNEVNILKKTNSKLLEEKNLIEKTFEEKKSYIIKLERKLSEGAENAFLKEQNEKLIERLDKYELESKKLSDKEEMLNSYKRKLDEQMTIFKEALKLKIEELKDKNKIEVTEEVLYALGVKKKEFDEIDGKNTLLMKENSELKKKMETLEKFNEELRFAKSKLTQMYASLENKYNTYEIEKTTYDLSITQLKNEIETLKRLGEKHNKIYVDKVSEFNKDESNNMEIIEALEVKNKELMRRIGEEIGVNNVIYKELEDVKGQYKEAKKESEERKCANDNLKSKLDKLKNEVSEKDKIISGLSIQNESNLSQISALKERTKQLEANNVSLLENLKEKILGQESIEVDLVRQNKILYNKNKEKERCLAELLEENRRVREMNERLYGIFMQLKSKGISGDVCGCECCEKEDERKRNININKCNHRKKGYYTDTTETIDNNVSKRCEDRNIYDGVVKNIKRLTLNNNSVIDINENSNKYKKRKINMTNKRLNNIKERNYSSKKKNIKNFSSIKNTCSNTKSNMGDLSYDFSGENSEGDKGVNTKISYQSEKKERDFNIKITDLSDDEAGENNKGNEYMKERVFDDCEKYKESYEATDGNLTLKKLREERTKSMVNESDINKIMHIV